jgi:hypothetical protein
MFFEDLSPNKNLSNVHPLPPQKFTQLSCLYYWQFIIKKYKDGVDSSNMMSMENLIKTVNLVERFLGKTRSRYMDTQTYKHYTISLSFLIK